MMAVCNGKTGEIIAEVQSTAEGDLYISAHGLQNWAYVASNVRREPVDPWGVLYTVAPYGLAALVGAAVMIIIGG